MNVVTNAFVSILKSTVGNLCYVHKLSDNYLMNNHLQGGIPIGVTPNEMITCLEGFQYTIKGNKEEEAKIIDQLFLYNPEEKKTTQFSNPTCIISKLSSVNNAYNTFIDLIKDSNVSMLILLLDDHEVGNINKAEHTAASYGTLLIIISGSISINDLFNKLLSVFTEKQNQLQKIVKSDYLELLQLVKQNSGLTKIIEAASDIVGNPVIITDESFKLLGYASSLEVNDPIWSQIVSHGYCPFEIVKSLKQEGFLKDLQKKETPLLLTKGEFSKFIRRVVTEININGEIKGYIAILEYDKPFSPIDFDVINYITSIVGLELYKTDAIAKAKDELWCKLLKDLIEGNIEDEESALNRVRSLDWKLKEYMQVLIFKNSNNKKVGGNHFPPIQSLITKEFPGSQLSFSSSKIVALITKDQKVMSEKVLDKLSSFCNKHNLKIGLGNSYDKLKKINQSYNEAQSALAIADKLQNSSVIHCYNNYAAYDMLSQIKGENYIPDELLKLYEYDQQEGTEHLTTLTIYLRTGLNLTETAKQLFIHRNTVLYRIKNIQEILNVNLDNYSSRINIELGLMLLDLNNITP